MADQFIQPVKHFKGDLKLPGDKSISHRALIFGALAEGQETEISNLLESADVESTARCLRQLGVKIEKAGSLTKVTGMGLRRFQAPREPLDCGNSGTTMRLLMGLLSALSGMKAELTGDESLRKRPMRRVAEPLRFMGAELKMSHDNFAPLTVIGANLRGIDYELKVASAQIKTAVILAGLHAEGKTRLTGEIHSRDHSERMLPAFGIKIQSNEKSIEFDGDQKMRGCKVRVPGDPSTAAFWLAAAQLIPGSDLTLKDVSLNPSRTGFLDLIRTMGGTVSIQMTQSEGEPIGDLKTGFSKLKGATVTKEMVPRLIDELPMIAVLATQAEGKTVVSGAEELRVKETDRIEAVAENLRRMGAQIETTEDGFVIEGPQELKGAEIESFHDHRIAMAFSIAGLVAKGQTRILNSDCVAISYPEFYGTLKELTL